MTRPPPSSPQIVDRTRPVEPPPAGRPWTLLHLLRWSTQYLGEKDVPEARLQSELLLAHALGLARLDLYLQYDRPLEAEELDRFRPLLRGRARREPVQYLLGSVAFRDLELRIDRRALIPRPETEGLVEEVLGWMGRQPASPRSVLEIGTGSGAIALALRTEADPPLERIVATDLSEDALALARSNAERLGADGIDWRTGAGFDPLREGEVFDVVVSNPPYVSLEASGELEPEVVSFEPAEALFAGTDGLEVLSPLIAGAGAVLREGGLLALEIGADQGPAVQALAERAGNWREIRVAKDLSGRDRYLLAARME